jgi:hypothetical protein
MPIEAFDRFTLLRTSYGMGIYRQLFSFVNVFHVDKFENSVSPERVMFSLGVGSGSVSAHLGSPQCKHRGANGLKKYPSIPWAK